MHYYSILQGKHKRKARQKVLRMAVFVMTDNYITKSISFLGLEKLLTSLHTDA